jgi:hypothetical protein
MSGGHPPQFHWIESAMKCNETIASVHDAVHRLYGLRDSDNKKATDEAVLIVGLRVAQAALVIDNQMMPGLYGAVHLNAINCALRRVPVKYKETVRFRISEQLFEFQHKLLQKPLTEVAAFAYATKMCATLYDAGGPRFIDDRAKWAERDDKPEEKEEVPKAPGGPGTQDNGGAAAVEPNNKQEKKEEEPRARGGPRKKQKQDNGGADAME